MTKKTLRFWSKRSLIRLPAFLSRSPTVLTGSDGDTGRDGHRLTVLKSHPAGISTALSQLRAEQSPLPSLAVRRNIHSGSAIRIQKCWLMLMPRTKQSWFCQCAFYQIDIKVQNREHGLYSVSNPHY